MKNLIECINEGAKAYQSGCKLSNNPYSWRYETLMFEYWNKGFKVDNN